MTMPDAGDCPMCGTTMPDKVARKVTAHMAAVKAAAMGPNVNLAVPVAASSDGGATTVRTSGGVKVAAMTPAQRRKLALALLRKGRK